jgi:hypothetical protein
VHDKYHQVRREPALGFHGSAEFRAASAGAAPMDTIRRTLGMEPKEPSLLDEVFSDQTCGCSWQTVSEAIMNIVVSFTVFCFSSTVFAWWRRGLISVLCSAFSDEILMLSYDNN